MSDLKSKVLNWMATGDVGESSKAMALCATGTARLKSHPYDPPDFNRCLLLVKEIPEIRDHFDDVAKMSDTWAALIENWNELEECFLDEVGLDWSKGRSLRATNTYEMMDRVTGS